MSNYNQIIERATLEVFEEIGLPAPTISHKGVKTSYTFGNGLQVDLSKGIKNPQEEYQRIQISHFFMEKLNKRMEILRTLSYDKYKERLKEKLEPLFKDKENEMY